MDILENWATLPPLTDADPAALAAAARDVLDAKKALDLAVIPVTGKSDITDYLVLATATSSTHVRALAEEVEFRLGERGAKVLHEDGRAARGWRVVDYGSVMVHVFDREAREFYNLDKLYKGMPADAGEETP